ncbi:MAG: hypothetical protein KC561_04245, partial [Myxococcales bacterium]|nr:hypothetical protein [Myxococcales bacterium]
MLILSLLAAGCSEESVPDPGSQADVASDESTFDFGRSDAAGVRTFTGDYSVDSESDLDDLQVYDEITGSLTIRGTDLDSIELSRLRSIGDELRVSGNQSLTELRAPNLTMVGGLIITGNDALQILDGLAAIEEVRGDASMTENSSLVSVEFPALTRVRGNLSVGSTTSGTDHNEALESLQLGALTRVDGTFQLATNPQLETVTIGSLEYVGGLFVVDNDSLASFSAASLAEIDENLRVADNQVLADLSVPALLTVGENFRVTANPTLPQCRVQALFGRVAAQGFTGTVEMTGNDEAATCPDLCSPVGPQNPGNLVCLASGETEVECVQGDCLDMARLCERRTGQYRYNQC